MSAQIKKIEVMLDERDISGFLKSLGAGLKDAHLPTALKDFPMGLKQFSKFTLEIKRQEKIYELKIKVKTGDETPSFKELKKRLKTSAKYIQQSLERHILPPSEAVDSFLNDAKEMSEHIQGAPDDYAAFINLCAVFKDAIDSEDKDYLAIKLKWSGVRTAYTVCYEKYM